ncbi:MAG: AAA family ATPase [Planctomycetota bacterium]|nr:AAA family ATPase [Planctomycetota bacterium]
MECIAVINQKGGVGKTATAVNLGAALAQRGRRVLLIDLDPQSHLTAHLGLDEKGAEAAMCEVLTDQMDLAQAACPISPNLFAVPSRIDLAATEMELTSVVGREVILRDSLEVGDCPYEFVLVDCPPSLGVLTLNALSAATQVLIPVQPHFLSLQGVGKLLETTSLVSRRINPALRVAGMVMCLYESGTRLSGEVIEDLQNYLDSTRHSRVPWRDARIFRTRIRRNVKLAECPSYGQTILDYAPKSNGAIDYLALGDEVIELLERPSGDQHEESSGPCVSRESSLRVESVSGEGAAVSPRGARKRQVPKGPASADPDISIAM